MGVRHRGLLGFGNKVRKEGEGAGSPPQEWWTWKGEARQLTNPFGWHKNNLKEPLSGEVFVKSQLTRLKRRPRQTLETERQIPIRWSKLQRRTGLLKTMEHLWDHHIGSKIHTSQGRDIVKCCPIALNRFGWSGRLEKGSNFFWSTV